MMKLSKIIEVPFFFPSEIEIELSLHIMLAARGPVL